VPKLKALTADIEASGVEPDLADRAARNLIEYDLLARRDNDNIAGLSKRLAGDPVIRVPYLDTDVHDVAGLCEINRFLFADEETRIELATG
jgi:hypothetical protein